MGNFKGLTVQTFKKFKCLNNGQVTVDNGQVTMSNWQEISDYSTFSVHC